MRKRFLRILSALLAVLMLMTGCETESQSSGSLREYLQSSTESASESSTEPQAAPSEGLTFAQMEYVRPDMDALNALLEEACTLSQGNDVQAIMDAVYAYYDAYDWFYTYLCIADIRYSQNLTDAYWEEEYNFCMDASATVDAGLEELYYTLAMSPCREELEGEDYFGAGFFDSYDGDNNWDETFTAMMELEAELENQYYAISARAAEYGSNIRGYYDECGEEAAQILVDLITLRQAIAEHWGYDNYVDFAWDFYYYRDYTPQEMETYMASISRELVPIYRQVANSDVWHWAYQYADEEETEAFVREVAQNMGGIIWESYELMSSRGLSDISYSANKYGTSFEVYLTSYQVPFVFVCSGLEVYDRLTYAHEFGHFCNDVASEGSYAGIDVLEVFSQAMEYLALYYGSNTEMLTRIKLADGLCTYVEQSAFATFEHRAYSLKGADLSVEGLCKLYNEVALEFGFDSVGYEPIEFITISHFYTNPLYIDSYVVSNDAALQIYLAELDTPGMGLRRYVDTLDTEQEYFLSYVKEAHLESPFAPGQLESVRDLFRQKLLGSA